MPGLPGYPGRQGPKVTRGGSEPDGHAGQGPPWRVPHFLVHPAWAVAEMGSAAKDPWAGLPQRGMVTWVGPPSGIPYWGQGPAAGSGPCRWLRCGLVPRPGQQQGPDAHTLRSKGPILKHCRGQAGAWGRWIRLETQFWKLLGEGQAVKLSGTVTPFLSQSVACTPQISRWARVCGWPELRPLEKCKPWGFVNAWRVRIWGVGEPCRRQHQCPGSPGST